MKISKEDPIYIIGASVSGLFMAWALHHYGFSNVQVMDRHAQPTWPKIPIHLGSQVLNTLGQMERVGDFERIGVPWQKAGLRWSSDKVFHRIDLDKLKEQTGYLPLAVAGPALRQVLTKDTMPTNLLPGHEFISFTQNSKEVEAHFSQGQVYKGGLMIAADGIDSRVRLQMKGQTEKELTELATWRVLLEPEQIEPELQEAFQPARQEYLGPGLRAAYFPLKEGQLGAEFTAYAPSVPQSADEAKAYLQESFAKFPKPIPQLLESLPAEQLSMHPHADRSLVKSAHQGRVVLIGEAAQPTLPYLGLETNLGIMDALVLARLLDESRSLNRALSQFERKHRHQAKRFHKAGHKYDRTVSLRQRFRYALRKMIYPALPGRKAYGDFYKINLSTV